MSTARIEIIGGGEFQSETGENLLREALRNEQGFPYDCNSGGCGSCQVEIVKGEVADLWEQAPGLSPRARSSGRRLACQSQIVGDCTVKVRQKPEYRPMIHPVVRSARLEERRQLTHDMAEYTFWCDGEAEFLPGQYAMLRLPNVDGDRAYSMSNRPNADGLWSFIVKRVPGGQGTKVLSEDLQIGNSIQMDGPYGMSYLKPDEQRDIICIGGGSGISPLKSICSAAVRDPLRQERKIYLFYGGRTPSDICVDQAFNGDDLVRERVEIIPAVSDAAAAASWPGEQGYIHEVARRWLESAGNPLNYDYYFCGPPRMIDAVNGLLQLELRVPAKQLHADSFV